MGFSVWLFICRIYGPKSHPKGFIHLSNRLSTIFDTLNPSESIKMADPQTLEQPTVRVPVNETDIDICFINEEGRVSIGNSWLYASEPPRPPAPPHVLSQIPSSATVQIGSNRPMPTVTGPPNGTSLHGSQHQSEPEEVEEYSLIPSQFIRIEEGESLETIRPDPHKDSYFTLM
jgi:hypothetical protein